MMLDEYRTALMALVTALMISLALGQLIMPLLRRLQFRQVIREDGPARHLAKGGTPTMGGLIFLPAFLLAASAWTLRGIPVFLVLIASAGFALLGFGDDYLKIGKKRSLGLRARQKLLGQVVLSLSLVYVAVVFLGRGTSVYLPGLDRGWELGNWFYPFAVFIIVGFSNAVNLTDGLDGLAAGIAVLVSLAYVAVSVYLGRQDLAVVAAALAGACGGFLAYNYYPAKVFMGDTGSLAIGAALASLAILSRTEFLLVLVGGVFVWETLTVILQVLSFQLRGKRIWRMSPYHHHLELLGWSEVRVVTTLWAAAASLAVMGVWWFSRCP